MIEPHAGPRGRRTMLGGIEGAALLPARATVPRRVDKHAMYLIDPEKTGLVV